MVSFVDEVIGARANSFVSGRSALPGLLEHTELNMDSAAHFIRGVRPTDVAVVIQSKSRTPPAVREAIFSALRAAHTHNEGPTVTRAGGRVTEPLRAPSTGPGP